MHHKFLFIYFLALVGCYHPSIDSIPPVDSSISTDQVKSDLYSTFLLLETLDLLNHDLNSSEKDEIVKWISSLQVESGKYQDPLIQVSDVNTTYYGVNILNYLDAPIEHTDKLQKSLNSLLIPDGFFVESNDTFNRWIDNTSERQMIESMSLITTYRVLKLLDMIDADIENQDIVLEWLSKTWDQHYHDKSSNLSKLVLVSKSIMLLSPDDPRLSLAWSEIESKIQDVFNETGEYPSEIILVAHTTDYADILNITASDWKDETYLEKLLDRQKSDGGYSIAPEMPNSDPVGARRTVGVSIYFGLDVPDEDKLVEWILSQRVPKQGFFWPVTNVTNS